MSSLLSTSLHERPNRIRARLAVHPLFRGYAPEIYIIRHRVTSRQTALVVVFGGPPSGLAIPGSTMRA